MQFGFTPKQRENIGRVLTTLIGVDFATLVGGNLLNPRGFSLFLFGYGSMLGLVFFAVLLWVDR